MYMRNRIISANNSGKRSMCTTRRKQARTDLIYTLIDEDMNRMLYSQM